MHNDNESTPDCLRPRLPTTASGVACQGTCENYDTAGLSENKKRKRGGRQKKRQLNCKRRETHSHKDGYLKCMNNDWKGKRAGRHDGAKKYRCTVPTENKVERE